MIFTPLPYGSTSRVFFQGIPPLPPLPPLPPGGSRAGRSQTDGFGDFDFLKFLFGCFLKWWYPQIIHFNRVFHYKPSILGYHYFWKHPFCHFFLVGGWGDAILEPRIWTSNLDHIVSGGFKYISLFFTPEIGEMIQADEHIFQMGWFNHQLVVFMKFLWSLSRITPFFVWKWVFLTSLDTDQL